MRKNVLNITILTVIFLILSIVLYGRSGSVLIDFSRESYIPYQMLQNQKLGQDIFLIYGPFGYLFNLFLYKIFLNINVLLIEGILISYFTVILFYLILIKYISKNLGLLFSIFFILLNIFSNSNFSFVIPYSYSTLWAIFGIYAILFFHLYKKEKIKYLFLGFVAINKIELFIFVLAFILIHDLIYKKFSIKNYLLILIFPLISLIFYNPFLFFENYKAISQMTKTDALASLYNGMGSFFEIKYFIYNLKYLVLYLGISLVSYFIFKKNKIVSILFLIIMFLFINIRPVVHLGAFVAIILTIINYKKIKKRDLTLLCFSLILCSKAIFAIDYLSYSNFGFLLLIFYILRQLFIFLDKKWVLCNFIALLSMFIFLQYIEYLEMPKYSIKTDVGKIKLYYEDYKLFQEIKNYLDINLKENEDMIVVPEGQIFNLIYKKPWKYYNSTFTPLDFETFREDKIISKLKENKTDYIIFYPRNTKDYGAQIICYDYGVDFCTYIMDNYTRVAMFGNEKKALIFKINEK